MIETSWKILCLLFIAASFLPLFDSKHWFFRVFDFLRLQLSIILLMLLASSPLVMEFDKTTDLIIVSLLMVAVISHLLVLYPYFPLKQPGSQKLQKEITAIAVNVKQDNQQYDQLIETVKRIQPDILLTIETNKTWESNLKEIEDLYTTIIRVPKDNRYGMHFYTRLEVKQSKVHYLISDEYPSIETTMVMNNHEFVFWCIHPPPPSPTEKTTAKLKDAELLKVARMINKSATPTLITGDFNNVTWSRTSRLFSKVSKLQDARTRRGFIATFPARYRLLRFPIDLLFHSKSISIGSIKTINAIGSDHLPLLFSFSVQSEAVSGGQLNEELNRLVTTTIKKGKEAAQAENG